jgi:hypothetical protein
MMNLQARAILKRLVNLQAQKWLQPILYWADDEFAGKRLVNLQAQKWLQPILYWASKSSRKVVPHDC